jgi:hypothetical protein
MALMIHRALDYTRVPLPLFLSRAQMNSFLTERHGKSGSTAVSPMASFTRFMMAVTAAFAVLCALLVWSAVLALTSFGAAAYLPRPVPLPLSSSSCLYLVLWTIGVWYTWKTPAPAAAAAGDGASSVQLTQTQTQAAGAIHLVKDKSASSAAMMASASAASARESVGDDTIALVIVDERSAGVPVAAVDSRP